MTKNVRRKLRKPLVRNSKDKTKVKKRRVCGINGEINAVKVCETKTDQTIDKNDSVLPKSVESVNKSKSETKARETDAPKRKRAKSYELVCDWNDCHYMARTRREILDHKNKHLCVKPYKCPNNGCEKAFFSGDRLRDHIKYVHSLEKTIPCEWKGCSTMFKNISALNAHMKIHEIPVEERPYVCDVIGCSYRTLTKANLEKHKIKCTKVYKCCECDRVFQTEYFLNLTSTYIEFDQNSRAIIPTVMLSI